MWSHSLMLLNSDCIASGCHLPKLSMANLLPFRAVHCEVDVCFSSWCDYCSLRLLVMPGAPSIHLTGKMLFADAVSYSGPIFFILHKILILST